MKCNVRNHVNGSIKNLGMEYVNYSSDECREYFFPGCDGICHCGRKIIEDRRNYVMQGINNNLKDKPSRGDTVKVNLDINSAVITYLNGNGELDQMGSWETILPKFSTICIRCPHDVRLKSDVSGVVELAYVYDGSVFVQCVIVTEDLYFSW